MGMHQMVRLTLRVIFPTSAKINFSYSILFNLTTSYSSYFGDKKGISRNKTSFFLLMYGAAFEVNSVMVEMIINLEDKTDLDWLPYTERRKLTMRKKGD